VRNGVVCFFKMLIRILRENVYWSYLYVVKVPLVVNGCLKASYFKYFINHRTRFLLNDFNDSSEYDDSDKKVLEIKEKQVAFSSSDEENIYLHQYTQYNTKSLILYLIFFALNQV
jgi:hypothetical protein